MRSFLDTRRGMADEAQFALQALELARLRLPLRLDVAALALRFFFRLFAQVGDGDPAPEHVVAAQPQLRFRIFRKAVAHFGQSADEIVEGRMVHDVDKLFHSSAHS